MTIFNYKGSDTQPPTQSPTPKHNNDKYARLRDAWDKGMGRTIKVGRTSWTVGRWMRISLIVIAGVVIWLNIQPYIGMLNALLAGQIDHPFVRFVLRIPGVGWVLNSIGSIFISVLGFLLWIGFQIAELMPQILNSSSNLKRMIFGFLDTKTIEIHKGEPEFIKRMKTEYNRRPMTWLHNVRLMSNAAYLLDFVFCALYYPPIRGGIGNIDMFIAAPSLDQIDFRNLALSLVTLFAVELVLWVWLLIDEGQEYLVSKKNQEQDA